jgi:hypothetical protein
MATTLEPLEGAWHCNEFFEAAFLVAKQGEALRPLKETLVEELVSEEVEANGSVRAADVVAIAATQCNQPAPGGMECNAMQSPRVVVVQFQGRMRRGGKGREQKGSWLQGGESEATKSTLDKAFGSVPRLPQRSSGN